MAQNTHVAVPANAWTELTDADITTATIQNLGSDYIWLAVSTSATAPTSTAGAIKLLPATIIPSTFTLIQLWPGVTGGDRLFAYSPTPCLVMISHA